MPLTLSCGDREYFGRSSKRERLVRVAGSDRGVHGYARALDGAYIAYQVVGEGPLVVAFQFDVLGGLNSVWDGPMGDWFEGLAGFARLILHDRRGTGVSSRDVAIPNLETRVSDLVAVLDAIGVSEPIVLAGMFESGAPNVVFAGADPERVRSLVWVGPMARSTWTPDYPWGARPEYFEAEQRSLEVWGTSEYGQRFIEDQALEAHHLDPSLAGFISKASRATCTPDVARALMDVWYQTDVRGALPAVQAPTLLIDTPAGREEADYIASLMPNAVVEESDPPPPGIVHVELVRRFLQVEPARSSLDTILATVMFTDIVRSTEQQAALGDHQWRAITERHHALVRRALQAWRGVEHDTVGDGFYATFDGPARAIHCALEIRDHVRELGIEIRVGIHTGECELVDGKCAGIAVTTGARIAALADPSQVLVSQTVKDLVAGSGLSFDPRGERELKGVPGRWRTYSAASSS
jgi:class 3 adenylate cyclase/pimeloyl-ACP methyl ester carboxylesterase